MSVACEQTDKASSDLHISRRSFALVRNLTGRPHLRRLGSSVTGDWVPWGWGLHCWLQHSTRSI